MQNKKMTKGWFYFLSFTWGILHTLPGLFMMFFAYLFRLPIEKNGYGYRTEIGTGWGGFSLGPFSITSTDCGKYLHAHEFGHGIQNCYFGPFMIIITCWSVCRYWYRSFLRSRGKDLPPYDSIWFEGNATDLGKYYLED